MAGMRNGIMKRGKTWTFVIQVPDPATGKAKPKWTGGYASFDEAKAAREIALGALRSGTYIADDRQTLGEFLHSWIASKDATPKTLSGYRYNIEHYIVPRIGGLRLPQVTPGLLTTFYARLLADGGRGGAPLGWPSVQSVARTMSSALGTAEKRGMLPRNPARLADLPPRPLPSTRAEQDAAKFKVFDAAELATFSDYAATAHRLGPFFYLAGATGARRGELLHLRWEDVDLDARQLHIRGSRGPVAHAASGHAMVIDGPTKTKKPRTVSLSRHDVSILRQHRQRQLEERLKAGELWIDDDDFVFRTERGAPIWPETPSSMMKDLCAKAGVRRLKLHELRHSHATILLNHGVPVHEVSQRLGHANTNETLKTYARVIKARQDSLGDLFAEALRTSS